MEGGKTSYFALSIFREHVVASLKEWPAGLLGLLIVVKLGRCLRVNFFPSARLGGSQLCVITDVVLALNE